MTDQSNPEPRRLDQELTEETQIILKGLLDRFPDLRTVALVLDYHLADAGSLPAGTWLPSRNLTTSEVLDMCRAVDKVGFSIRQQHGIAAMRHIQEVEQRAVNAEQRVKELEAKLTHPIQSTPAEDRDDAEETK